MEFDEELDTLNTNRFIKKEDVSKRNEIVEKTTEYQLQKLATMKRNLPRYINKRKREFAREWVKFQEENTMDGQLIPSVDKNPLDEIVEHTFAPLVKCAGQTPSYSADELALAFDFYTLCANELKKTSHYLVKIEDFCRLVNISRSKFDNYQKTSPDENMREVCNKIQDYCTARATDDAVFIKDKAVTPYIIFHQKSSNKQKDNEPIQNNTYIQNNTIMTDEMFKDMDSKYSS